MQRKCECKGVRACALCDLSRQASHRLNVSRINRAFVFCSKCSLCFQVDAHTGALGEGLISLNGIQLAEEAISLEEETQLENAIEATTWVESQSGRRKQDFGPKVNFKKQKIRTDAFLGFPKYMEIVYRSFGRLSSLSDFEPIELCNLKYSPDRGSCIDPHFDDSWLWGERLVTLNLRGATVLTFSQAEDFTDLTKPTSNEEPQYALSTTSLIALYKKHQCPKNKDEIPSAELKAQPNDVVHVILPRRSLVIVEDEARSKWHHSVLREHVHETRLAMTCRELSEIFLNPVNINEFEKGQELLQKAKINPQL